MNLKFACAFFAFFPNCGLADDTSSNGQKMVVLQDGSPISEDASLRVRVKDVDSCSVSLRWFRESNVVDSANLQSVTKIKERDVLLKFLHVSDEEKKQLDELFEKRRKAHVANRLEISVDELRERDFELKEKGVPLSLLKNLSIPPLDKADLDDLLAKYAATEKEAEEHLAKELSEIIDPLQYQTLVQRWLSVETLFVPIGAKYLDLSEEQVTAMAKDALEMRKLNHKLDAEIELKKASGKVGLDDRGALKVNNKEWWEARFRPFSRLTPEQFLNAMHWLSKTGWTKPVFSERIKSREQLCASGSVPAIAEMAVLADLYREGVVLESRGR